MTTVASTQLTIMSHSLDVSQELYMSDQCLEILSKYIKALVKPGPLNFFPEIEVQISALLEALDDACKAATRKALITTTTAALVDLGMQD